MQCVDEVCFAVGLTVVFDRFRRDGLAVAKEEDMGCVP